MALGKKGKKRKKATKRKKTIKRKKAKKRKSKRTSGDGGSGINTGEGGRGGRSLVGDLVDEFIGDLVKRKFIVFAGAGVPEITNIPTWKDLLKALEREQQIKGVEIEDINTDLYPEVAQMLFVMFEREKNIEAYHRMIKETMQPKSASHTILQQEIILATGRIITTNFDSTFEKAFQTLYQRGDITANCEIQRLANLEIENVKKENFVTYLHGRYDDKAIIFKTTDYEKYYVEKSILRKFLEDIYIKTEEAIVFVGFSFNDRYIMRTFETIHDEIKRKEIEHRSNPNFTSSLSKIKHYALLESPPDNIEKIKLLKRIGKSDPDLEKHEKEEILKEILKRAKLLEEKLESMNIKVLRYKHGSPVELEDWFKEIKRKRGGQREAWLDKEKEDDVLSDMPRS